VASIAIDMDELCMPRGCGYKCGLIVVTVGKAHMDMAGTSTAVGTTAVMGKKSR